MLVMRGLCVLMVTAGLMGCQGSLFGSQPQGTLSNHDLMALWEVYTHCQTSDDLRLMRADVKRLHQASDDQGLAQSSHDEIPDPLKGLIAKHPLRLSVDPRSMLASCALQTAQAAFRQQDYGTASTMFKMVVREYSEHEYPYYVREARSGLVRVSLTPNLQPARSVPVSSR